MTAIAFAMQVLAQLPALIEAGVDVYDLVVKTNDDLKAMKDQNRAPSDAEWQALNDSIEELRSLRPILNNE